MHYVLVTIGTRGDVQPFVALGKGLAAAGHAVTIATHDDFKEFVEEQGLGFRPVGGSFRTVLESQDGREWIESGDSLLRYMKAAKKIFRPLYSRCLADVDAAVEGADVLLIHSMAGFAISVAQQHGTPFAVLAPIPMVKSGQIEAVMFARAPAWRWLRRFLQRVTHEAIPKPVADLDAADRRERGLSIAAKDPWTQLLADGVPFLHLYSESLVPRPTDWPSHATVNGFCFLEESEPVIPDGLEAFLDGGEQPIYIGFGSMTGRDPELLATIAIEAVQQAKVRAVIVTGWGGIGEVQLPPSMYSASSIPHDWLFPRVRAVIHHGGAGTTAAGLRAGRPTLVVSFFGDQPFWGRRVEELGAGPRSIHRTKLSSASLANRITDLITRTEYADQASRIGKQLRNEHGVAQAVSTLATAFR